MKKIVFSTLTAFFAVGTALLACDSAEEATSDTEADSGSQTSVDGSGDMDGSSTEADGSTDSSTTTDATADSGVPPTDIEVTVLSDNKPIVGATVVFGDSTGKMTKTVYTDAQGKIKETISGGEMITVAGGPSLPDAGTVGKVAYVSPDLVTIMGVKPGDKLVVPFYPGATAPAVDVTFQTSASAVEYGAYVGACGNSGGTTLNVGLEGGECMPLPGAPFSVLGYAWGEGGYVGAAYKKGQMLAATGNTTVDFVAGTQPASAAWAAGTTTLTANLIGTLPEAYISSDGAMISDGLAFEPVNYNGEGKSASMQVVNGFADSLQTMWYIGGGGERMVVKRFANSATTLDTAYTEFLPLVTPATADVTDPARPVMKWTPASAATIDGVRVKIYAPDPFADRYLTWHILNAPGANELKVPEVPANFFDGTLYLGNVELLEADFVSSYDQFKQAASVMATRNYDVYMGGSRSSGTVRVSRFSEAK